MITQKLIIFVYRFQISVGYCILKQKVKRFTDTLFSTKSNFIWKKGYSN